ncbi:hypothetical protein ACOME3_003864 [Neoechinorhynchus agilis]
MGTPTCVPLSPRLLATFATGAVVIRGAADTINDIVDTEPDSKVARTNTRPLVTGDISQRQALVFLTAQISLAFLLALTLMPVMILSPFDEIRTLSRPKNHSHCCIVLGLTLNIAYIMGYNASANSIIEHPFAMLTMYTGYVIWSVLYDCVYGCQDAKDDSKANIQSITLKFYDRQNERFDENRLKRFLYLCILSSSSLWSASCLHLHWTGQLGILGNLLLTSYAIKAFNPADMYSCQTMFKRSVVLGGGFVFSGLCASRIFSAL